MDHEISLTDAARRRIATLCGSRLDAKGVRLTVGSGGCSGFTYDMEIVETSDPADLVIEVEGGALFIDPFALGFLAGSEIDHEETAMSSGFRFRNPNEAARCGCGKSFAV